MKKDTRYISFADAASNLERICQDIEHTDLHGIIEHELEFHSAKESLAANVDRRYSYIQYLQSQIDFAEKERGSWAKRVGTLTAALESIRDHTLNTMLANPGLKFVGHFGGFQATRSAPALEVFDVKKVPSEFKELKEEYVVDRASLKNHLIQGGSADGARLTQNMHIRMIKERAVE